MIRINLYFLAVIAFVGVGSLALHLYQANQELKRQRGQLYQFATLKDQETQFYKNANNQLVSRINTMELDTRNLKELADTKELEYLKQFDGLKKSLRNLETAVNANISITSSVNGKLNDSTFTKIDGTDTLYVNGKSFKLQDEFRTLSVSIVDSDITVDESMKVPLSVVTYWERKKIIGLKIGKKYYITEATSKNPHVKVEIGSSIVKRR